jgi:hypothetical protein
MKRTRWLLVFLLTVGIPTLAGGIYFNTPSGKIVWVDLLWHHGTPEMRDAVFVAMQQRLRIGMTTDEVWQLLGNGPQPANYPEGGGEAIELFDGEADAWYNFTPNPKYNGYINVLFLKGKLVKHSVIG